MEKKKLQFIATTFCFVSRQCASTHPSLYPCSRFDLRTFLLRVCMYVCILFNDSLSLRRISFIHPSMQVRRPYSDFWNFRFYSSLFTASWYVSLLFKFTSMPCHAMPCNSMMYFCVVNCSPFCARSLEKDMKRSPRSNAR
jgi:hypothetical protein